MAFDDDLPRALETVQSRLGDELARVAREVSASANLARDEAVRSALLDAERQAEERLTAAVAAAEAYAIERAVIEGRRQRAEGHAEGLAAGREEGKGQRAEGKAEGRAEGRTEGRAEGREEGRAEGREEGRAEGRTEGRTEGLAEGHRVAALAAAEALDRAIDGAVREAVTSTRAELLEAFRAGERAAGERLVAAVESLSRGRSLTAILDTLAATAAREAGRAAIVVIRGARFHGWRLVGFDPAVGAADRLEFGVDEAGVIADAARAGGASTRRSPAPHFASLSPERASVAFPVSMGGQIVAVLYADEGPAPELTAESSVEPTGPRSLAWTSMLDLLARHAGRCLETLTISRAAIVAREAPLRGAPLSGAPLSGAGSVEADDVSASERYARLLVSEIKLYREADVMAGRRDRDLMARLGGEIARAQALYEQRVPAAARQGADHFHAELVRVLANGDERLLEVRSEN